MDSKKKHELSLPRPPVVVVLGHVDHGKTSILDYIRKTNVVQKEVGQITQHIGAYEIEFQGQKITFIDTPGHEAFTQMRSHGADLADIALLVIAGNEGVKPQTKESLGLIKSSKLSYIVVLNKADLLPQYQAHNKVEEQLKKEDVKLEAWGGDVPLVKTSVKTGEGIEELLETILILSAVSVDSLNKTKKKKNVNGIIIETHLSSQSGICAAMLVKEEAIKVGDLLGSDEQVFKVKKILNWQGNSIDTAYPSQPVSILGFNIPPELGEIFKKIDDQCSKKVSSPNRQQFSSKEILIKKCKIDDAQIIKVILKTDVLGSQEAINKTLENISREFDVNFLLLHQGLGEISESDLKLAQSSGAIILGFKIKAREQIKAVAERLGIKIAVCDIIYNIKDLLTEFIKTKDKDITHDIKGKLKVLAVFQKRDTGDSEKKKKKVFRMIIGGELVEGKLKQNCSVDVHRNDHKIGQGKIIEIEKDRRPTIKIDQVGEQCGLLYEGNAEVKKNDLLVAY